LLEGISKTRFWFNIEPTLNFPALRDFPSDFILFVGHNPEVRLRRIEGFERGSNKGIGPKDIFETASIRVC
jgi:hypothetical protein